MTVYFTFLEDFSQLYFPVLQLFFKTSALMFLVSRALLKNPTLFQGFCISEVTDRVLPKVLLPALSSYIPICFWGLIWPLSSTSVAFLKHLHVCSWLRSEKKVQGYMKGKGSRELCSEPHRRGVSGGHLLSGEAQYPGPLHLGLPRV